MSTTPRPMPAFDKQGDRDDASRVQAAVIATEHGLG